MLGLWSGGRRGREAAQNLYQAIVVQARRAEFYTAFGVADSIDGRFDLLALHCFLVLRRLTRAGRAGLAQALFDRMFADMDQNLRELGVSDLGVGHRVKAMAEAFYGRIAAYEQGLADEDALAPALARNLYRGQTIAPDALAAMCAYVRTQALWLDRQDAALFEQGRVAFAAPQEP